MAPVALWGIRHHNYDQLPREAYNVRRKMQTFLWKILALLFCPKFRVLEGDRIRMSRPGSSPCGLLELPSALTTALGAEHSDLPASQPSSLSLPLARLSHLPLRPYPEPCGLGIPVLCSLYPHPQNPVIWFLEMWILSPGDKDMPTTLTSVPSRSRVAPGRCVDTRRVDYSELALPSVLHCLRMGGWVVCEKEERAQGRCRQTDGALWAAGGGLCSQMGELLCLPGTHPLHFHFHLPDFSVSLASLVGFYRIISCLALVAGNRLA